MYSIIAVIMSVEINEMRMVGLRKNARELIPVNSSLVKLD